MEVPKSVSINGLRIGGVSGTSETLSSLLELLRCRRVAAISSESHIGDLEKEWKVQIPDDLKTIPWEGVREAIFEVFPDNDFLLPEDWKLLEMSATNPRMETKGFHAVRFMYEERGCHSWFASWKDGDARCRVYVSQCSELTEDAMLTAFNLVDFLVDYAIEGIKRYRNYLRTMYVR